jgi:formylmethanofuran dehydrogenase subunit C
MITLRPAKTFRFPIFAECVNPNILKDKTVNEIEQMTLWEGNRQRKLGDLFKVEQQEPELDKEALAIEGDVSKVRRIGTGMQSGKILIHGDVGMHLGAEMKSGKITVHGNAGAWAGTMMKDGTIEINGNAGS